MVVAVVEVGVGVDLDLTEVVEARLLPADAEGGEETGGVRRDERGVRVRTRLVGGVDLEVEVADLARACETVLADSRGLDVGHSLRRKKRPTLKVPQ